MHRSTLLLVITMAFCILLQSASWAANFGLVSSRPTMTTGVMTPTSPASTVTEPRTQLKLEPVQIAPSIQFKQNENGGIAPTLEFYGRDGFVIAPNRNFIYSFEVKIQDSTAERSADGAVETFELFGGDIEVSFNAMYEYVRSTYYGAQFSVAGSASLINGPSEVVSTDSTNDNSETDNSETLVYQAQVGFGLWLRYAYLGLQYSYNQASKTGGDDSVSQMIDGTITRKARLIVPINFNQSPETADTDASSSASKYFLRLEHTRGDSSDRENTSLVFTTTFNVF